ncbi:MAG: phosphoglycerate kinase [Parcubacteria group bacterium Gr01-1014_20]|nr:MAG: phosphoglycerate kinase [Parcubacteria group bacterium Gr01-1014_20]
MKFLRKAKSSDLKGVAIVALDFNTEDDWRLRASLPTVKFLSSKGAKVLILSHKGRPKGIEPKLSLKKDAIKLAKLTGLKVSFINNFNLKSAKSRIAEAPKASVFVLENIRFLKGEYDNSPKLAKELAGLGDFYVNDAFANSHRDDVSVDAITRFLPSFAGFGFEGEILHLSKLMKKPKRPLVLIVGGGKADDKVALMKFFKNRADYILTGGAAANTLLLASGYDIQGSLADRSGAKNFRDILKFKNLLLPLDYAVSGGKILDIGAKTVEFYVSKIKEARTVIWNGPVGLFEKKPFDRGTLALARAVAGNGKCFSVAGGGETVMFLKKHGLDKKFTFISTGGGAMLDFLAGKKLPGVEALRRESFRRRRILPRRKNMNLSR